MTKLTTIMLVAALSATGMGQSRISMGRPTSAPAGGTPRHFGPGISVVERGGHHRQHPFWRSPFFYGYGYPYFYPDDYGPYEDSYERPEPPPQPAPVVQEEKLEPLPDPVLLELHGNQWVRVTNFGEASQQALNTSAKGGSQPTKEIPPALLVYRDGHSEEVSSYSIIGEAIYTKSDYWSSGSWTRTIQIADLDIPATLKQNQQRGVKFNLPSGPNEVVIRP